MFLVNDLAKGVPVDSWISHSTISNGHEIGGAGFNIPVKMKLKVSCTVRVWPGFLRSEVTRHDNDGLTVHVPDDMSHTVIAPMPKESDAADLIISRTSSCNPDIHPGASHIRSGATEDALNRGWLGCAIGVSKSMTVSTFTPPRAYQCHYVPGEILPSGLSIRAPALQGERCSTAQLSK